MPQSRRDFLVTAAAFSAGFAGLHTFSSRHTALAQPTGSQIVDGFGPLISDPNGIFDLPEGFSYRIVSRTGETMDDGFLVPGVPDGMAAFPGPDGQTVLICNHELSAKNRSVSPFGADLGLLDRIDREAMYDFGGGSHPCIGGTTSILYDTRTQETKGHKLSLCGTIRNCAGGPTPWNTWISCEEDVTRAGGAFEQDHGWNFEVPSDWDAPMAKPVPIKAMGRFNHEAVAVDPKTHIIYQTEDRNDGLIYRFLPEDRNDIHKGGRLEALVIARQPGYDTRNWDNPTGYPIGASFEVSWIPMDNTDAPDDDLRYRGHEAGAALFARGEGMWTGTDGIYFACTNGGPAKMGQVWRYVPSPFEGTERESEQPGRIELFVEPNDGTIVGNCDNLTVTPWGDLILCEDGSGDQFLVGVTPQGDLYKFARNAVSQSELAGACFSPDGTTLFVNIQVDGLTLAITGPWHNRA